MAPRQSHKDPPAKLPAPRIVYWFLICPNHLLFALCYILISPPLSCNFGISISTESALKPIQSSTCNVHMCVVCVLYVCKSSPRHAIYFEVLLLSASLPPPQKICPPPRPLQFYILYFFMVKHWKTEKNIEQLWKTVKNWRKILGEKHWKTLNFFENGEKWWKLV